jgi:hypothetical protein
MADGQGDWNEGSCAPVHNKELSRTEQGIYVPEVCSCRLFLKSRAYVQILLSGVLQGYCNPRFPTVMANSRRARTGPSQGARVLPCTLFRGIISGRWPGYGLEAFSCIILGRFGKTPGLLRAA